MEADWIGILMISLMRNVMFGGKLVQSCTADNDFGWIRLKLNIWHFTLSRLLSIKSVCGVFIFVAEAVRVMEFKLNFDASGSQALTKMTKRLGGLEIDNCCQGYFQMKWEVLTSGDE